MSTTEARISKILETHFCDVPNIEEYETEIRKNTETYFKELGLKEKSEYHKALADEKRLGILTLLGFREMCVCELTSALGVSQPNLSHHIKKLEYAGLVKSERRGKW